MNKDSTFGIKPQGLANLLGIGITNKSKAETDQVAGELLRARLAGTLPLDSAIIEAIPAILGRLREDLIPLSGRPLGEALLESSTDIQSITKIKEHGKKLAGRKDSDEDHAVGVVIYYAAIASALLNHNTRITQHSYRTLADAFERLRSKTWMPLELGRHFAKAVAVCREKAKE